MDFYQKLPKLELHAHLNGCLSKETLKKLAVLRENNQAEELNERAFALDEEWAGLTECFQKFKIAHSLTQTPYAVTLATREVITMFSEDGVVYLELRTTPRHCPAMSKRQYIEAVLAAIQEHEHTRTKAIQTCLILSLNRTEPENSAAETVQLAIEYNRTHPGTVRGIDVSGDPSQGTWFPALLRRVRTECPQLRITVHCAEIPNDIEAASILSFQPDRIGHGTFILPKSPALWHELLKLKVPVECCLTSNIRSSTVGQYADHHLAYLLEAKHPVALCTDDTALFNTMLSKEFRLAAEHFQLSNSALWQISYNSIEYAFCEEQEKQHLRDLLNKWAKVHLPSFTNL